MATWWISVLFGGGGNPSLLGEVRFGEVDEIHDRPRLKDIRTVARS